MKFSYYQVFLICLFSIYDGVNSIDTKSKLFVIECNKAQINELLFFGTCYGQNENIYKRLVNISSEIKNFQPESTLKHFLTNYIFLNSSKFFEEKYQDKNYSNSLTELKTELKNVLAKMETTLSNVVISDFLAAFQKSSFDAIISEVITDNQNQINSLEENNPLRYNLTCRDGTFCQLTKNILNIKFSNDLNNLTVSQFLKHIIKNGFKYLNNIFLTRDLQEAEKTIDRWNTMGTTKILMSEVANFMDNRLVGEILYAYEPYQTTKKTSTTTSTKIKTTPKKKVTDEYAVPDGALWSIPIVILLITIIGSVTIVYNSKKPFSISNNKMVEMENQKTIL